MWNHFRPRRIFETSACIGSGTHTHQANYNNALFTYAATRLYVKMIKFIRTNNTLCHGIANRRPRPSAWKPIMCQEKTTNIILEKTKAMSASRDRWLAGSTSVRTNAVMMYLHPNEICVQGSLIEGSRPSALITPTRQGIADPRSRPSTWILICVSK